MKKWMIYCVIAAAALTCVLSCKEEDHVAYMTTAVLKDGQTEYWQQIAMAIRSRSINSGLGSFLAWSDSDDDVQGQLESLDTLDKITGMSPLGLIIAPIYTDKDHRVEQKAAEYASKHGVPVVVIDTPIDVQNSPLKNLYKCYVGTDNVTAGKAFARNIEAGASSMVAFIMPSSQAALQRFAAFTEEKGAVDAVYTDEKNVIEKIDSVRKDNPSANTYVFFNGSLCNAALEHIGDKDVYTFDIYKEFLVSVREGGCIKGIMGQNTFEMGQVAVMAIYSQISTTNLYIDPIYIDRSSASNSAAVNFYNYYGI